MYKHFGLYLDIFIWLYMYIWDYREIKQIIFLLQSTLFFVQIHDAFVKCVNKLESKCIHRSDTNSSLAVGTKYVLGGRTWHGATRQRGHSVRTTWKMTAVSNYFIGKAKTFGTLGHGNPQQEAQRNHLLFLLMTFDFLDFFFY